jgi:Zn-dependent metalloprotease
MPDAALAIVDAAKRLYGKLVADKVRAAFQERGILPAQ